MNKVEHTQNDYNIRVQAVEFPMMSVLAFSYLCNALCPNCPYTNSSIRNDYKDAKFMSEETFKKIAKEVGENKSWLRITGGGEPTLHPKFLELMKYAKDKRCKLGIITNGSKMDEKLAKSLLELNVDMLEFSVDAHTKENYDIVRKGLNFSDLVENIQRVYRLRNQMKSTTQIIASAINQKGINVDEVEKFWLPYVDQFQKRKYLTWGINDEENSADDTPYLPPQERIPCPFLFERLNIDSLGQVMICGFDIVGKTNLGNIHDQSIKEIWHGKGFEYYRQKHLQRKGDDIELCKNCPDWKYRSWKHNYWKLVDNAKKKRNEVLKISDEEGSIEID